MINLETADLDKMKMVDAGEADFLDGIMAQFSIDVPDTHGTQALAYVFERQHAILFAAAQKLLKASEKALADHDQAKWPEDLDFDWVDDMRQAVKEAKEGTR